MRHLLLPNLRLQIPLILQQLPLLLRMVILRHLQRHQRLRLTFRQTILVFVLQMLHFLLIELQLVFILLGGFFNLPIFIPAICV